MGEPVKAQWVLRTGRGLIGPFRTAADAEAWLVTDNRVLELVPPIAIEPLAPPLGKTK